jgi:hypothetical protein
VNQTLEYRRCHDHLNLLQSELERTTDAVDRMIVVRQIRDMNYLGECSTFKAGKFNFGLNAQMVGPEPTT